MYDTEIIPHFIFNGGFLATRLMLLLFLTGKFYYAYCRDTGTLAGDHAGTDFVLFLTKFESYII